VGLLDASILFNPQILSNNGYYGLAPNDLRYLPGMGLEATITSKATFEGL
jgi:hypothetical protein